MRTWLWIAIAWLGVLSPAAAQERIVVVASLQPLYSIAHALAQGTPIDVRPVPANLPGPAQLSRILGRGGAAIDATLREAQGVVSLLNVWPDDPLFREARARNIRVVRIDAGRSLAPGEASVAQIAQPVTNVPWRAEPPGAATSPYVWFSPSNTIRMAEIVAADFQRLAPAGASRIAANLAAFAAEMRALKAEFEARLLAAPDPQVFALTDRFAYLTNEFGLLVDGYFLEQDARWTPVDLDAFAALLRDRAIRFVIHHWQPSDAIAAAIARAGARLIVLDDGEGDGTPSQTPADPLGYQRLLRANLELLARAISP